MKKGFFEMEMISGDEVNELIRKFKGYKYVCHVEPTRDHRLFEVASFYGEIPNEYADCVTEESAFGFEFMIDMWYNNFK